MAVTNFTQDVGTQNVYPEPDAPSLGKTVNILGAVASLALIVGVGIWGYKLLVRDVSGVPVVRAVQGPMRVQPEKPGGHQADHQGLAVNAVAAEGAAAAPADRLLLAPRPVELAEEDTPMSQMPPVQTAQSEPGPDTYKDTVAQAETGQPSPNLPSEATIAAFQGGDVDKLVDDLIAGVRTPDTSNDQIDETGQLPLPNTLTADEATPAVFVGPGLRISLRPQLRPIRAVVTDADAVAKAVAASLDVDPDTLPSGTRLAQLGAYDSADVARTEWDRLQTQFGDYLDGKSRVIQKASSGGRTFYRLRAMGFEDLSDARRFCSALIAENADCIPVTSR